MPCTPLFPSWPSKEPREGTGPFFRSAGGRCSSTGLYLLDSCSQCTILCIYPSVVSRVYAHYAGHVIYLFVLASDKLERMHKLIMVLNQPPPTPSYPLIIRPTCTCIYLKYWSCTIVPGPHHWFYPPKMSRIPVLWAGHTLFLCVNMDNKMGRKLCILCC